MSADPTTAPPPVEQLRHGDRLTREEFERRYHAMPGVKKAELIEGVVHMPSPVRILSHGNPHSHLIGWLCHYEVATPGVISGVSSTARLDVINEPQPDGLMLIDPACGGQARISDDDYIEHAPELVSEIAASTAAVDVGAKREVYRRTGAKEYLLWRVTQRLFDWFILRDEAFVSLAPGADGVIRSEAFPGLWLDPAALLRGDMRQVMAVAAQGVATPEHAAFVAALRARRGPPIP